MELTHFNQQGLARMVEVSNKQETKRTAVARGHIRMSAATLALVQSGGIKKGDVLSVAQIAGIMGAKKTSDLIPMCHNLFLTGADLRFAYTDEGIEVIAEVRTTGKTGVEMEALTAVSTACLTIYDMCKAVDKEMQIGGITLIQKTGGKSGAYLKAGTARVRSVNFSSEKGVVKHPIAEGVLVAAHGLEGDAHAGPWHRQVSLLGIESFDKMRTADGPELTEGIFAENITTEGILLYELPIGTKLKIGETLHEVTQIGKECHTGCEIAQKVGQCVMPKEGIFTKVLVGGIIRAGDPIEIVK